MLPLLIFAATSCHDITLLTMLLPLIMPREDARAMRVLRWLLCRASLRRCCALRGSAAIIALIRHMRERYTLCHSYAAALLRLPTFRLLMLSPRCHTYHTPRVASALIMVAAAFAIFTSGRYFSFSLLRLMTCRYDYYAVTRHAIRYATALTTIALPRAARSPFCAGDKDAARHAARCYALFFAAPRLIRLAVTKIRLRHDVAAALRCRLRAAVCQPALLQFAASASAMLRVILSRAMLLCCYDARHTISPCSADAWHADVLPRYCCCCRLRMLRVLMLC